MRDIRRMGSCALDLCHVAEGRLDGYVEEGVNLWDHAAGALIAEAAGARWELASGRGREGPGPVLPGARLRRAPDGRGRGRIPAESRE